MDDSPFFNDDFFFGVIVLLFLAEFVTGLVQLIGAIIRTSIKVSKGEPLGRLKTYWIMVGIYFLVLLLFYVAYQYLLGSINPDDYESEKYERYMDWYGYLAIATAIWIFAAWGIAIWYNIKIVFNRKSKITEIEHV
jgi:hypothetical protein